jgi:hypothetical protein
LQRKVSAVSLNLTSGGIVFGLVILFLKYLWEYLQFLVSKACLGMIKGIQEAMNIQRPAVEPLIVWVSTEREDTFQIN